MLTKTKSCCPGTKQVLDLARRLEEVSQNETVIDSGRGAARAEDA